MIVGAMKESRFRQSVMPGPIDPAQLRGWYATPLGRALEEAEVGAVREALGVLFGFHMVLVAPPWEGSPLDASRISHRMVMAPGRSSIGSFIGDPQHIPVCADTLDLMILPHTLEVVANPHEVLREVDRCLVPEGQVLILGFNPFGLWGLWRLLYGWRRRPPWNGRFISAARVRDWLALLGFDTVSCRPLFFRPPSQALAHVRLQVLDRLAARGWPMPAAGYQLLARKRVVGMTPVRPRWRPRRSLLAGGLAEPSPRSQPRESL